MHAHVPACPGNQYNERYSFRQYTPTRRGKAVKPLSHDLSPFSQAGDRAGPRLVPLRFSKLDLYGILRGLIFGKFKKPFRQNLTQNSQLVERFQDTPACSRDQKGIGDKRDGPLPPFIHGAGSEALAQFLGISTCTFLLVRNC